LLLSLPVYMPFPLPKPLPPPRWRKMLLGAC
jgi:hypothetical protein